MFPHFHQPAVVTFDCHHFVLMQSRQNGNKEQAPELIKPTATVLKLCHRNITISQNMTNITKKGDDKIFLVSCEADRILLLVLEVVWETPIIENPIRDI